MLGARGSTLASTAGFASPIPSLARIRSLTSSSPKTWCSARQSASRTDQEIRLPTSSAGTPRATAASIPAAWSEVWTTRSAPNSRPASIVPSVMVTVNSPKGLPARLASRYSSGNSSSDFPATVPIKSSQTSRCGKTSKAGSPARAPASTISADVASRTSCPAARAAQTRGMSGSVSP